MCSTHSAIGDLIHRQVTDLIWIELWGFLKPVFFCRVDARADHWLLLRITSFQELQNILTSGSSYLADKPTPTLGALQEAAQFFL